jgi:hypothetical protein
MKLSVQRKETYINHAMCDCGGEYKFTEFVGDLPDNLKDFLVIKNGYIHTCDKCGKTTEFTTVYPEEVTINRSVSEDFDVVKYMIDRLNKENYYEKN